MAAAAGMREALATATAALDKYKATVARLTADNVVCELHTPSWLPQQRGTTSCREAAPLSYCELSFGGNINASA